MNTKTPLIKTGNLTKKYGIDPPIFALRNVSISVEAGECVAITGPSGSGKSTLLNLIGALDKPTEGQVLIDGINIETLKGNKLADFRREKIGFIFQMFNLIPGLTALENVTMPLRPYLRKLEFNLEERGIELLKSVGLGSRLIQYPGQLSGGEQQRVAIARALINQPNLILADEPTGNLDTQNGNGVLSLLTQLNRESGITLVLVTHNSSIASQTRRIINLKDGGVV